MGSHQHFKHITYLMKEQSEYHTNNLLHQLCTRDKESYLKRPYIGPYVKGIYVNVAVNCVRCLFLVTPA